jgi:hypothetical protein
MIPARTFDLIFIPLWFWLKALRTLVFAFIVLISWVVSRDMV